MKGFTKKFIVIVIVLLATLFCCASCEVLKKNISQSTSYKDPQTIGGYWTVTMQTGQTFYHAKCSNWRTEDDTAVFEMDDGTLICQSGAVVCVKENR